MQVFFVDDLDDPEWKVVLEKQPRSKRHSTEDDDALRPDAAQHVFDAPGLSTPLTRRERQAQRDSSGMASTSRQTDPRGQNMTEPEGENVPIAEVIAANINRESDEDPAGWLDDELVDDDDNLPYEDGLARDVNEVVE